MCSSRGIGLGLLLVVVACSINCENVESDLETQNSKNYLITLVFLEQYKKCPNKKFIS